MQHIPLQDPHQNPRFNWSFLKKRSLSISKAYYESASLPLVDSDFLYTRSTRVQHCCDFLEYKRFSDGDLRLHRAFFCSDKFCPTCHYRRYLKLFHQLSVCLDNIQSSDPNLDFVFITLTLKNVQRNDLWRTVDKMFHSWSKLRKRLFRMTYSGSDESMFKGFFLSFEITYHRDDSGVLWFHPHFHIIGCVDRKKYSMYSWTYKFGNRKAVHYNRLEHSVLLQLWRECLDIDYDPNVDIRFVYSKKIVKENVKGLGFNVDTKHYTAAEEAARYAFKDELSLPGLATDPEPLAVLSMALKDRRLYNKCGIFKDMFHDPSDDLLVIEGEEIRDDLAYVLESYHWHGAEYGYCLD